MSRVPSTKRTKETDKQLLDWAETHPEDAMDAIDRWWEMAGPGCREVRFEFRNILRDRMNGKP